MKSLLVVIFYCEQPALGRSGAQQRHAVLESKNSVLSFKLTCSCVVRIRCSVLWLALLMSPVGLGEDEEGRSCRDRCNLGGRAELGHSPRPSPAGGFPGSLPTSLFLVLLYGGTRQSQHRYGSGLAEAANNTTKRPCPAGLMQQKGASQPERGGRKYVNSTFNRRKKI